MTSDLDGWPGARSEYEVHEARGYGLTPEDLRRWWPSYPLDIYWASKNGLSAEAGRRWLEHGIAIQDAVRAAGAGLSLDDVLTWTMQGFMPADAVDATEAGVSMRTAIQWREFGFVTLDAVLLIQDGWTLAGAAAARYGEVVRYEKRLSDFLPSLEPIS